MNKFQVGILYEHPQWHEPLFQELEQRKVPFVKIDLKSSAYCLTDNPEADVYYNLVSPSAYIRNNQKAIPFAYSICKYLEGKGCKVLNGTHSMNLELSKSSQMNLLESIGIHYPKTIVFNSVEALWNYRNDIIYPQILKPEQEGSGSRI